MKSELRTHRTHHTLCFMALSLSAHPHFPLSSLFSFSNNPMVWGGERVHNIGVPHIVSVPELEMLNQHLCLVEGPRDIEDTSHSSRPLWLASLVPIEPLLPMCKEVFPKLQERIF